MEFTPIIGDNDPSEHIAEAYARILAVLNAYGCKPKDVGQYKAFIGGIEAAVEFLKGKISKEDLIERIMRSYSQDVKDWYDYLISLGFELDTEQFVNWINQDDSMKKDIPSILKTDQVKFISP